MSYSVRTTRRFDRSEYRPHKLTGNLRGKWECHIKSNWLLVWEQYHDELLLIMIDTGTHSDLF